jgi:hypothetical protein
MSNKLAALGIPVKVLIDSAVAYSMDEVDMVFVGADGVVESGGIINMMGTYQIALVAHSMNKPVYVAAESYKVLYALITHGNDIILLMLFMFEVFSHHFPKIITLWRLVRFKMSSRIKNYIFVTVDVKFIFGLLNAALILGQSIV